MLFKDGQGEHHEIEVSEKLFLEFRQMERRNRNLQQWNQRHREFNEVWDETLYRRALRVPKTLDETTENGFLFSDGGGHGWRYFLISALTFSLATETDFSAAHRKSARAGSC